MTGQLLHWTTLTASTEYYTDLESILPSFVAVFEENDFTSDNMKQLEEINKTNNIVRGILIVNSTMASSDSSSSYHSPASTSPRGQNTESYQLTPDNGYDWNPNGDGLLNKDLYGIPTAYVSDADIGQYMLQAAKDQSELLLSTTNNGASGQEGGNGGIFTNSNVNIPPINAEFNMYMGPKNATATSCLTWIDNDDVWRPKCLPLGGNSVWAKAGSPPSNNDNENGIILVATNIDSTSMFHDIVPGANTAASNILTVLMAAKLLGQSVDDETLDGLNKQIVFAFFQGEQYGYLGSRSFIRDLAYPGFECDEDRTVPTVSKKKNDENYRKRSCLYPLRQDLDFMQLGNVDSMIAVDQVGILSNGDSFYVHDSGNSNGLSNILLAMNSDDWSVSQGSAGSIPPTPLSSLINLSGGDAGGVVLSGYDETFTNDARYLSHTDSYGNGMISLDAIAKASTLVARAALASAYGAQNGYYNDSVDYAKNLIAEIDSSDETLVDLANCLFSNGMCDTLKKYSSMGRANNRAETGLDIGIGQSLGSVPNYYVGVFDHKNSQPYAYIGGSTYGSYTGNLTYGDNSNDAVLVLPNVLEMGIHGLLDDFLGRGTNGDTKFTSCQSMSDCSKVSYCSNSGDFATCSGSKVCVCSRAHYHQALDEAIVPASNNSTGKFVVSSDDGGVSPMYSEPYWDSDIGVHVYREGEESGSWTLGIGIVFAAGWVLSTIFLKKKLRKEKLY